MNTSEKNLESIAVETDAALQLLPPAVSQPKDERRRHPVATVYRRRHCRLPGLSPTGVSLIGHGDQHC